MEHKITNLNLSVNSSSPSIIHLLEGKAPDPINPIQVVINGNISAVTDYLKTRKDIVPKDKSYIIFDEAERTIILRVEEDSPLGTAVRASLSAYPELEAFGINSTTRYSLADLEKHIRMNRFFFADQESHGKLLSQLRSFTAKIQSDLKAEADQRGNKSYAFNKTVDSDLSADFVLYMPIYKGLPSSRFRVEICYDVTDSSVRFWLESVELFELEKSMLLQEFEKHKKQYVEDGFTVMSR